MVRNGNELKHPKFSLEGYQYVVGVAEWLINFSGKKEMRLQETVLDTA